MHRTCRFTILLTACALTAIAMPAPLVGCGRPRREASYAMPIRRSAEMEPAPTSREQYEHIAERGFTLARSEPLSTFSIDVDTASYANMRRFLTDGSLPPKDAVRVEELINYFEYDYPAPAAEPLAIRTELGPCPWNEAHQLLHVGLKARELQRDRVPPRNLVFLIDVSGSMEDADKLPLLKHAMGRLVSQLRSEDRIAIVVYAGSEGLVLPPTSGDRREQITQALHDLSAGGSTNGGAGIELAYRVARDSFRTDGINRVILASDGDFNVGTTSQGELVRLIEREREGGVFLTVLGFGTGNLQDHTMESLADHGNGNYAYIDSEREAEKVLVREADSTLMTVAKDVKVQLELNPATVSAYRLLGYENRALHTEDFRDDRKDAGELGAGDTVTAIYEIVPAKGREEGMALRFQGERSLTARAAAGSELAVVAVRYQPPEGGPSRLLEAGVSAQPNPLSQTTPSFRFSAAVAGFGLLLRGSAYAGSASYASLRALAAESLQADPYGDRQELLALIDRAQGLRQRL